MTLERLLTVADQPAHWGRRNVNRFCSFQATEEDKLEQDSVGASPGVRLDRNCSDPGDGCESAHSAAMGWYICSLGCPKGIWLSHRFRGSPAILPGVAMAHGRQSHSPSANLSRTHCMCSQPCIWVSGHVHVRVSCAILTKRKRLRQLIQQ